MRRLSLLAVLVALTSLFFVPEAIADHRLLVDKDKAQCPNADYTSIQAAVDAADTGDTILVCPDVYNEHVMIKTPAKNGLRIRAKGKPEEVVLDGLNTMMHGFELGADAAGSDVSGVLIEGFHVTRYHDNIWLHENADENRIRKNVTTAAWDHDGIVVQGDRNLIERNLSFGQLQPIGCGMSVGTGGSHNVFRHNETYGNANAGILLGGGILGPAGPGNRIVHNYSHDNGKPVVGVSGGVGILNAISPGALIAHNDVRDNAANGILLTGAATTGVVVNDNEIQGNVLNGIGLVNGDNNTIRSNESEDNGVDGIRADSASSGNAIRRNEMEGNVEHDCHDDSVGSGSAGTANFWIDNEGETENRPGLCGDDD